MAKEYQTIPDKLVRFINEQKVFFIATAAGNDDVNVSPKGVAMLKVIDERTVAYADYYGSGAKTAEHLSAGGKATIMFVSFDKEPLILRLFCEGRVAPKGSDEFEKLAALYPGLNSDKFRQIFRFDVRRVQRSCGYGAPLMEYRGDRSAEPYFRELYGE